MKSHKQPTIRELEQQLRQQAATVLVTSDSNLTKRVINQIRQQNDGLGKPTRKQWFASLDVAGMLATGCITAIAVLILTGTFNQIQITPEQPAIAVLANTLENELDFQVDQLVAQREAHLQSELASLEADMQKIGSTFGLQPQLFLK